MNQIARAWVAKLRSGRHRQGIGALISEQDGNRHYCCLGLAYTVIPDTEIIPSQTRGVMRCRVRGEEDYSSDVLTEGGRVALGLNDDIGSFSWASLEKKAPHLAKRIIDSTQSDDAKFLIQTSDVSLATLNDAGVSFETIADVIEAEPDGLFTSE